MASKFQKRPFPIEKLGRFLSITVSVKQTQSVVEIPYSELKLIIQNGQLCFLYESPDGDLIMPIARKSTIESLFEKE